MVGRKVEAGWHPDSAPHAGSTTQATGWRHSSCFGCLCPLCSFLPVGVLTVKYVACTERHVQDGNGMPTEEQTSQLHMVGVTMGGRGAICTAPLERKKTGEWEKQGCRLRRCRRGRAGDAAVWKAARGRGELAEVQARQGG